LYDDDVFYVRTSCGGGYGDPLDRPPSMVERDVQAGTVSRSGALEVYGVVVMADGSLDSEATTARRRAMRAERTAAVNPDMRASR
jgi:N-methylhydantoinase B